jgi:hypothetical protein
MGSLQEEALSVAGDPHLVRPARRDATIHWIFLAMATVVLALALLLEAPGGEAVIVPLLGQPLPGMCTFRRFTGVDCPGCGLTRCFISMAHGDLAAAWRFNPAGILLFAAAVFQVPFRLFQIRRMRNGLAEWRSRALDACLWLILFSLAAQWVGRMVFPLWL